MKRIKLCDMFLIFSWINFFAVSNNIYAGVMLMLAGAYKLCDVMPVIWKEIKRNAKGTAKRTDDCF